VIDTMTIAEREVRDRQGHWFTMRIRPYKNLESRIDGAVVALIESDAAHRSPENDDGDNARGDNAHGDANRSAAPGSQAVK
jgi:hypothetical protein